MQYAAILQNKWISGNNTDESFVSNSFDDAFKFLSNRINGREGYKQAYIVKCSDGKEEVILSFRTIK